MNTSVRLNVPGTPTWTIPQLIGWAVNIVLIVAGIIFFFMLIIGGIRWILSGGDKANTESARNQITAALIGLIIVFAAWALATLLSTVFGVDILKFDIPSVNSVVTQTVGWGVQFKSLA